MVTSDDADSAGSKTLVAVMVTVAGDGTVVGAVYSPPVEIVPQFVPPQPVPDVVQVTAVSEVPVMEAVNCWVAPGEIEAEAGLTATATPGDVEGLKFKTTSSRTLPPFAVRVAVCPFVTADTFAVKVPLVEFAGTVNVAGTATAPLLLDK